MPKQCWKVGELAARTGLTVRTLHHYDAIGLLSPSDRTESMHGSGHRLYTADDLARLHQILCLKQLGFALEQIREYMTRADYDPRQVIRLHLEDVRRKAAEFTGIGDRLRTTHPDARTGRRGVARNIPGNDRGDDNDRQVLHEGTA